jgi:hypothetical protein
MMTREELVRRLGKIQERQIILNDLPFLTAEQVSERMTLRAERARIEADLAALSNRAISGTAARLIRAAIQYVRPHDADLADELDALIRGGG